jgi:8-oxo-dGTP pyrophosphatase MutT (NUDIX family)
MMQCEIDKISKSLTIGNGFDYLWKEFWGTKSESPYLIKDKTISRANYDMLKVKGVEGPELDLKYIVSTVKAEYDIEEWGFPKGRKNRTETEKECAIREFKEESGYSDEDFHVIKNIEPLIEEFIGTNGIRYRHIYYIAELISNKSPRNDVTESQKDEIGNVQFMGFTTALECIRDYHIPRKILLEKLFTYYLDKLVVANRSQIAVQSDVPGQNTQKIENIHQILNIISESQEKRSILVKNKNFMGNVLCTGTGSMIVMPHNLTT